MLGLSEGDGRSAKVTRFNSVFFRQIGMLVRRLYPDIQRCKITVNGKRVWVYKNLALRKDLQGKEGYTPPTGHELPTKQTRETLGLFTRCSINFETNGAKVCPFVMRERAFDGGTGKPLARSVGGWPRHRWEL